MSKLVDRYQMTESECELSSRRALSFNSSQLSTMMSSAAGTMLAILSSGTGPCWQRPCWQGPCCQQELMQVINKKWVISGSERVQCTRHISKQWRHSRRESWPFKNGEKYHLWWWSRWCNHCLQIWPSCSCRWMPLRWVTVRHHLVRLTKSPEKPTPRW